YPQECIHKLFEDQAARTPAKVAVVCKDQELTYAQLDLNAGRLAYGLRKRGMAPGALVGILGHRSPDFLASMLAVFKAGGVYLPLDTESPPLRLRQVVHESHVDFLLASQELAGM